jgi:actin-like ATPase involved in cell morphogenesis
MALAKFTGSGLSEASICVPAGVAAVESSAVLEENRESLAASSAGA